MPVTTLALVVTSACAPAQPASTLRLHEFHDESILFGE
jgi:hypothetical protein